MSLKYFSLTCLAISSLISGEDYPQYFESELMKGVDSKFYTNYDLKIIVKRDKENDGYSPEVNLLQRMVDEFRINASYSPILKSPQAMQTTWEGCKQYYLAMAEQARKEAHKYLNEAELCSQLIPDVNLKEQLRVLISTSIGSLAIPDPKLKLLTIALAVIGDLANQIGVGVYDNFYDLREKLAMGAAYLEKSNYYYRLAMGSPFYREDHDLEDYFTNVSEYIEDAVQYLIIIDMYTTAMEYKLEGRVISNKLFKIREAIICEIEKHGTIITKHSTSITSFMEDLGEITSDCSGKDLLFLDEVYNLLEGIQSNLRMAEKLLGIKK